MSDDQKEKIGFWLASADEDWKTAEALLEKNYCVWALFIMQLSLEKIVKALIIQNGKLPPLSHDLENLCSRIGEVPEKYTSWLNEISTFNISARYDIEKEKLRKKATKEYSNEWHERAKEIRQWLTQQLN